MYHKIVCQHSGLLCLARVMHWVNVRKRVRKGLVVRHLIFYNDGEPRLLSHARQRLHLQSVYQLVEKCMRVAADAGDRKSRRARPIGQSSTTAADPSLTPGSPSSCSRKPYAPYRGYRQSASPSRTLASPASARSRSMTESVEKSTSVPARASGRQVRRAPPAAACSTPQRVCVCHSVQLHRSVGRPVKVPHLISADA